MIALIALIVGPCAAARERVDMSHETSDIQPSALGALLGAMPAEVAALADEAAIAAYLDRVRDVAGVAAAAVVPRRGFTVELAAPVDATALARRFGWQGPYAVSGDVMQRDFSIRLYTRELADPHGRRIATEAPRFGVYRVDARLLERPHGPLPGVSAGASPAYDLTTYAAQVQRIAFTHEPAR